MEVAMTSMEPTWLEDDAQPAELFHCDRCDDTGEVDGGPCSCVAGMLVSVIGGARDEYDRATALEGRLSVELFGHRHEDTDNRCLYEDDDGVTRCCYDEAVMRG
jgi:hypothetical protein